MKGDFSRRTFDPDKQYSAVLQEQGRMLTDADLEEEHRILADRIEEGAADLIGGCGGPINDAGFAITAAGDDLAIGTGRYYVDGVRAECLEATSFASQPYRHDVAWPPEEPGWYHVYLDVWRRLVTALDDSAVREVALGGPTTAAREQTVWQVKAIRDELAEEEGRDPNCTDPLPDLEETTGSLAAQADPEAATTEPCEVPPSAGFKGLENQFYRVEVHGAGQAYDLAAPTEVYEITGFSSESPRVVTLSALDGLSVGNAIEIFDEATPETAALAHIVEIGPGDGDVTLSVAVSGFADADDPRLRQVEGAYLWSRDNGTIVTAVDRIDGAEVTVRDLGRDDVLGFAPDQWVEITDDVNDFEGLPGQLRRIASIDVARDVIVLSAAIDPLEPVDPTDPEDPGVDPERHPKLRRWDGAGAIVFDAGDPVWLPLEDGVQVRFTVGHYRTGDWWYFPARTATIDPSLGNIEWPLDDADEPALLGPHGIQHHTCRVALVEVVQADDETLVVEDPVDCRNLFPPVTEFTTLLYVSGDGQEGVPDPANPGSRSVPLGAPIEVRVANGSHPVKAAMVEFIIAGPPDYVASNGRLQNTNLKRAEVGTNDDGIARCAWHLDGSVPTQTCMARLLDAAGSPIEHQVVTFHASLSTAARVAYNPSQCADLANATTVQAAIDILCQREPGEGGRCCCVTVGPGGEFDDIATAIKDLMAREERGICLCLLPGDHELEGLDLDLSEGERAMTLSISGCGRASRLHIRDGARVIGFRELALRRLDIEVSPGAHILTALTQVVSIEECRISGAPEGTGLVCVYGASRFHVADCTIEAIDVASLEEAVRMFEGIDVSGIEAVSRPFGAVSLLREFEPGAQEGALALRDFSQEDRVTIMRALLTRIREMGGALSAGESRAWRRLAEALARERYEAWTVVDHMIGVRFATGRATPAVAVEIGNLMSFVDGAPEFGDTREGAVVLENNTIVGLVSFYGQADPGQELSFDTLLNLRNMLREGAGPLGGESPGVHVRDNHLTRLAIGRALANEIEKWPENESPALQALIGGFHFADNIIDGVHSVIVARHVSLAHDQFTLAALRDIGGQDAERVVDVIGDTAVYTGNQGQQTGFGFTVESEISDITRKSAQAANLDIDFVP